MTIPEILEQLESTKDIFPVQALQAAILNKNEISPYLLDILENTVAHAEEIATNKDYYWGHIFAMFLLAQFREQRAFPLIIELLKYPEDILNGLFGDILTESADHLLGSTFNGDTNPLKSLIENNSIYEYVRATALSTMDILVFNNILKRDELINYHSELYSYRLKRERNFIWSQLVSSSTDLYATELIDDIRRAYDDGLVDEFDIDLKFIDDYWSKKEYLTDSDKKYEYLKNRLIDDTITELQHWFRTEDKSYLSEKIKKEDFNPLAKITLPKIGRNEPCPCGSGLKFKKCHGAK
jgi:hypothetical protein